MLLSVNTPINLFSGRFHVCVVTSNLSAALLRVTPLSALPACFFTISESESEDWLSRMAKVVFLGDSATGKSSLIARFVFNSFSAQHTRFVPPFPPWHCIPSTLHRPRHLSHSSTPSTLGIDFLSKSVFVGDRSVKLQLWDTAGQERFRALVPSYIRSSSVAVVVFDVASRATFESVDQWVADVRAEPGSVKIVLCGNKTDLEDRAVSTADGEAKAAALGVPYMETSAKTGSHVTDLFRAIAQILPIQAAEARMFPFPSSLSIFRLPFRLRPFLFVRFLLTIPQLLKPLRFPHAPCSRSPTCPRPPPVAALADPALWVLPRISTTPIVFATMR
jgi:Ras-related protein Rab-6A